MVDIALSIVRESWSLVGEMAPYLLFGFLVAGILSVCVSPAFVERHLGGRGLGPVVKATLFGVPLPLCSCGVIPVSASFRRHGASRAAVTSFLLSTPQTGIDSIAATYALLGWVFAAYRPVLALVTGLVGGFVVMLVTQGNHAARAAAAQPPACTDDCCAQRGSKNIVRRALEYGFVVLPRDIGVPLLIGIVIAGVIAVFVPPNELQPYLGGGVLAIVLMMLLGMPLYVCATASVPIAAALLAKGASPGAALAFLIAGPATNAATITTIWKLLGGRSLAVYLSTIAFSAVGGGLTLDWLMPAGEVTALRTPAHDHMVMTSPWAATAWAVLLLAVLAVSYARKPRNLASDSMSPTPDADAPERVELTIAGMTCSHCVAAVTRALRECPGVAAVQVELSPGRATVAGRDLNLAQLLDAVNQLGYTAQSVS